MERAGVFRFASSPLLISRYGTFFLLACVDLSVFFILLKRRKKEVSKYKVGEVRRYLYTCVCKKKAKQKFYFSDPNFLIRKKSLKLRAELREQ